jgi:hypothetical protein
MAAGGARYRLHGAVDVATECAEAASAPARGNEAVSDDLTMIDRCGQSWAGVARAEMACPRRAAPRRRRGAAR